VQLLKSDSLPIDDILPFVLYVGVIFYLYSLVRKHMDTNEHFCIYLRILVSRTISYQMMLVMFNSNTDSAASGLKIPTKNRDILRCSERFRSSCSTGDTRRVSITRHEHHLTLEIVLNTSIRK